jgi:hypothetical protein
MKRNCQLGKVFDFLVDDSAAGARILPALHTALVKVVTAAFVIKGSM